jgi:GNAT superfamily N-acetyltransferase
MPNEEHVDLTIRLAEAADAETLARLMGELGYETRVSEMQMRLESIAQDPCYRTFVAVKAGKVCGMIGTFTLASYEHNDPGGRILALVVSDGERGAGVGKKLVAVAENDFAQRNIRRIAVDTHLRRKEAHEFYERLGYEKTGFRYVKTLAAVAD